MNSGLYKVVFINHGEYFGYLVYRDCFDPRKCNVRQGQLDHRVAVFVFQVDAIDYCMYRNTLMDKHGSDELPTGYQIQKMILSRQQSEVSDE